MSGIPDWRKPKGTHEGDSLVLDIILFLEQTEEDTDIRDAAFQRAFEIASFCPNGVTRLQRTAIMNVLRAYGSEAIKPVLEAVATCPIPEVMDLAAAYVSNYNAPTSMRGVELLGLVKLDYSEKVRQIREEYCANARSTILWQNHQLVYFHSENCWSVLNRTHSPGA